jgi:hypothetical protein
MLFFLIVFVCRIFAHLQDASAAFLVSSCKMFAVLANDFHLHQTPDNKVFNHTKLIGKPRRPIVCMIASKLVGGNFRQIGSFESVVI